MIRRREERQVAALLLRLRLDLGAVGPAAVDVHVKRSSEAVVVVRQEVEQAVVALRPEALSDEVRPPRTRLLGREGGSKKEGIGGGGAEATGVKKDR